MDIQTIIDSIVGNALPHWLLLSSAGAVFLAYLKLKHQTLALPALFGIGALLALLASGACAKYLYSLSFPGPVRIQRLAREWLGAYGVTAMPTDNDGALFAIRGSIADGPPIVVRQPQGSQHLAFSSSVQFAAEQRDLYAALSAPKKEQFRNELLVLLSNAGVDFSVNWGVSDMVLSKKLSIATGITEVSFIERVERVHSAAKLAQAAISLSLHRLTKEQGTEASFKTDPTSPKADIRATARTNSAMTR